MTPKTVWLASFPKSGNTWVRAMLAALEHGHVGLNGNIRGSTIASARGPLERLTGLVSSELREAEIKMLRPLVDAHLDSRTVTHDEHAWHRKIHDALFERPDGPPIVSPEATRAAIYVVRDPRDVAVSYAHHMGRSAEEIVSSMNDPKARMSGIRRGASPQLRQHLGTWSWHVESWLDHRLFPVLLVRYEDLIADPVAQLDGIAGTLGRQPTHEQLQAAVDEASFDKLQAQEANTGFQERPSKERPFFRRGVAGAWREELPEELARRIESDHARVMTRLGYSSAEAL